MCARNGVIYCIDHGVWVGIKCYIERLNPVRFRTFEVDLSSCVIIHEKMSICMNEIVTKVNQKSKLAGYMSAEPLESHIYISSRTWSLNDNEKVCEQFPPHTFRVRPCA